MAVVFLNIRYNIQTFLPTLLLKFLCVGVMLQRLQLDFLQTSRYSFVCFVSVIIIYITAIQRVVTPLIVVPAYTCSVYCLILRTHSTHSPSCTFQANTAFTEDILQKFLVINFDSACKHLPLCVEWGFNRIASSPFVLNGEIVTVFPSKKIISLYSRLRHTYWSIICLGFVKGVELVLCQNYKKEERKCWNPMCAMLLRP